MIQFCLLFNILILGSGPSLDVQCFATLSELNKFVDNGKHTAYDITNPNHAYTVITPLRLWQGKELKFETRIVK